MPAYTYVHDIMLRDCEPSGIVFLPRYFDMVHTVVENWVDEALEAPRQNAFSFNQNLER